MRHVPHPDAVPGHAAVPAVEAEGRLLHKDWSLYDTAHVVFRPRHMTPEELRSRLRLVLPAPVLASVDLAAPARRGVRVARLPGVAYLYKRSNWLWHCLIGHRLVHRVWRPLVTRAGARRLNPGERRGR